MSRNLALVQCCAWGKVYSLIWTEYLDIQSAHLRCRCPAPGAASSRSRAPAGGHARSQPDSCVESGWTRLEKDQFDDQGYMILPTHSAIVDPENSRYEFWFL